MSFGLAHRKVTDLLSKSTILGSPGALGGPEKWKEVVFLKILRQIKYSAYFDDIYRLK